VWGKELIPSGNWCRAQQPPSIRSRIDPVVVEESAIEFRDLYITLAGIAYLIFKSEVYGFIE